MSEQHGLELSDIPGLGPVRQAALHEAGIRDLASLVAMTVEELAAIRGVGQWQARRIREFLRQRGLLVEDNQADETTGLVVQAPETVTDAVLLAGAEAALEAHAQREAEVEARLRSEAALLEAEVAMVEQIARPVEPPREEAELPPDLRTPEEIDGDRQAELLQEAALLVGLVETDEAPEADAAPISIKVIVEQDETATDVDTLVDTPAQETVDAATLEEKETPARDTESTAANEAPSDTLAELCRQREQLPGTALTLVEAIREAAVSKQLTRQITQLLITAAEFTREERPLPDEVRAQAAELLQDADDLLRRAVEKQAFGTQAQQDVADRLRRRRKKLQRLLKETHAETE